MHIFVQFMQFAALDFGLDHYVSEPFDVSRLSAGNYTHSVVYFRMFYTASLLLHHVIL